MNMQDVFASLLLTDPEIRSLVGKSIDWDVAERAVQGPHIVLFGISSSPSYTTTGATKQQEERVQIDCRATTAKERRALVKAIDRVLSGYRGTFAGVQFQGCFKRGQRTAFDTDGARQWFQAQVDYEIWWRSA